ncbi:PREDICTED: SNF1-related protein kinase regulatory subunit beta-1 isoform X2 [Tarenaya hassleriana]|uniref:SNF1-related protein kinase regulatory subunit beta-1 isoform X2 n=1 Tax=Tarenaya hassleriana TaxID=28532 RepID=UPI00053C3779|nr:PREDICTED: SNF1-related protein kinase regulatory subunit beta-1 isoform X2 [Tarenaya hassleriana]
MGNANGKEDDAGGGGGVEGGGGDSMLSSARSNGGDPGGRSNPRRPSSDSMSSSPPASPIRSQSPFLFAPQAPVAPLQVSNAPPVPSHIRLNQYQGNVDNPLEPGIPTIITWNLGGNDVAVEGSWDNWTSRKKLQRSGKDYSILLVLQSGIYHYKFIVDGERKYIPDLPLVSDEMGSVCNILDVHNFVPENPESIAEFEAPPSPEYSYSQQPLSGEDFAKEPLMVPSQLGLTVLGAGDTAIASSSSSSSLFPASSSKPQHVVLNHLFVQRERESQPVVALGLTHRFESKYITVVLYKPLRRGTLAETG